MIVSWLVLLVVFLVVSMDFVDTFVYSSGEAGLLHWPGLARVL